MSEIQENEIIGKRINLQAQNMKRVKIMTMLFEEETKGLNTKQKLDFIINKSIESFYQSKEIKELLI